jgi:hypothetical protein
MPGMRARRILQLAMALVPLLAPVPSSAQESQAAALGRQRAATSTVEWEVREAGHPSLGNIRFGYVKKSIETRVGNTSVFTRAYLSCQKDKRSFAIEISNSLGPADPGGLKPATDPRLYCHRPEGGKLLKEEILASWEVNPKLGDVLARGLRGFPLRECAAITVQQEVLMPEGSPQKTARIEFDVLPYDRELDSVFATCGERSAYGPAPPPVTAAAASAQPKAAPQRAAPQPAQARAAPPATGGWREARTLPTGKTNVRAGPALQTPVVAELHPGSVVMVQGTGTEWYRARPNRGNAFEGYIRQDRLVFK